MKLGAISALGGLAGGIFGGVKAAKAAREQKKLIAEQEAKNREWYNRNYYSNYLDSAEANAAMRRVENTLKRQNESARARQTVMGATPEAAIAEQEANNQVLSDTAAGLAAKGTARKANVDAAYLQMQNGVTQQKIAQLGADESGASQVMAGGLGLIGDALSLYDRKK